MWLPFSATFKRNFIVMKRAYPWSFFIGHILSGAYIVFFAYLSYTFVFNKDMDTRFTAYAGTNDYLSYVILGGVFFSFAVSMLMIVSRSIISELREGTLEALLLTPSSRKGYFLGTMSQGLTRAGIELLSILVIGFFFGLQMAIQDPIAVIILFIILLFSLFSQALVLGAFMLYFRDTYITQNTLFVLMGLVCGVTFPAAYLPNYVEWLSYCMPLTYGIDAFRMVMTEGETLAGIQFNLFYMMAAGILYLVIGSIAIKRMEYVVLEKHFG
ncbi:ABC transporter permease [Fictibacillus aquaticus]|uniref:Transport permease protein n=1 Tax=Fictibacillus aquaticus TaxID=2021314 RepID=A0A235FEX9_9BACL|nr:ABC transporter permease [Fictibacillus aquaticus]OYD59487.1 ABC transporter [Fictibacillus aquaticus]